MTDFPAIFLAPMMLALLREIEHPGTGKTMHRWIARIQQFQDTRATWWTRVKPGDRLWVREAWAQPFARSDSNNGVIYRADGPEYNSLAEQKHQWGADAKWSSPIHMPRWASRLTLIVSATKIERLQDISEEDAKAEGVAWESTGGAGIGSHYAGFCNIWTILNGINSWDANPEVVALSFRPILANIDAVEAQAA
jgi:hypothetical protein